MSNLRVERFFSVFENPYKMKLWLFVEGLLQQMRMCTLLWHERLLHFATAWRNLAWFI